MLCFPNSSAPTELSKSYEVAQRFKKISLLFFLLILTTKASCLLHLYPVVYTGQKRYKSFPYLHMAEVVAATGAGFTAISNVEQCSWVDFKVFYKGTESSGCLNTLETTACFCSVGAAVCNCSVLCSCFLKLLTAMISGFPSPCCLC